MKLVSVQVLRALAAVSVVIFHAQALAMKYSPDPSLSGRFMGNLGAYGVDLFFMISGFVICYTLSGRPFSAPDFLRRRAQRIIPIYFLLTAFTICLALTVPQIFNQPPILEPLYLLQSFGFTAFAMTGVTPILYVGWSLEYEVLFYLIMCLIAARARGNILIVACLVLCAPSLIPVLTSKELVSGTPFLAFLTAGHFLQFAIGMILCQRYLTGSTNIRAALLVLSACALSYWGGGEGRVLWVSMGATAIFLLFLTNDRLFRHDNRFNRALTKVGDASYSIYLIQVFTLPVVGKLMQALYPAHHPDFLVLVATVMTIAGGYAFYCIVERPIIGSFSRARIKAQGNRIRVTP